MAVVSRENSDLNFLNTSGATGGWKLVLEHDSYKSQKSHKFISNNRRRKTVDQRSNAALQLPPQSLEHLAVQLPISPLDQAVANESEQHGEELKRPEATRVVQHDAAAVDLAAELALDQLLVAGVLAGALMLRYLLKIAARRARLFHQVTFAEPAHRRVLQLLRVRLLLCSVRRFRFVDRALDLLDLLLVQAVQVQLGVRGELVLVDRLDLVALGEDAFQDDDQHAGEHEDHHEEHHFLRIQ